MRYIKQLKKQNHCIEMEKFVLSYVYWTNIKNIAKPLKIRNEYYILSSITESSTFMCPTKGSQTFPKDDELVHKTTKPCGIFNPELSLLTLEGEWRRLLFGCPPGRLVVLCRPCLPYHGELATVPATNLSIEDNIKYHTHIYRHTDNPANTTHRPNVWPMLGRRRRRWANIGQTLGLCVVFAGNTCICHRICHFTKHL